MAQASFYETTVLCIHEPRSQKIGIAKVDSKEMIVSHETDEWKF